MLSCRRSSGMMSSTVMPRWAGKMCVLGACERAMQMKQQILREGLGERWERKQGTKRSHNGCAQYWRISIIASCKIDLLQARFKSNGLQPIGFPDKYFRSIHPVELLTSGHWYETIARPPSYDSVVLPNLQHGNQYRRPCSRLTRLGVPSPCRSRMLLVYPDLACRTPPSNPPRSPWPSGPTPKPLGVGSIRDREVMSDGRGRDILRRGRRSSACMFIKRSANACASSCTEGEVTK